MTSAGDRRRRCGVSPNRDGRLRGIGRQPPARVGARVPSLLRERPAHAPHLPVLPGAVGPGAPVRDAGHRKPLVDVVVH